MKKLSVVLPTYNSQKYLAIALDAVVKQTYKNIELIVVDDGSTDNTHEILKAYAKKDERIKLHFNKKNVGNGNSRNIGIKLSTGYYITFIDHDDWQDTDRYQNMINRIQEDDTDVCLSYILKYNQDNEEYTDLYNIDFEENIIDLNKKNYRKKIRYKFIPSWTKLIKRKLILEHNLRFAEKRVLYEDVLFHSLLLCSVDKISIYKKHSYYHRSFQGSITRRYGSNWSLMHSHYIKSYKQAREIIKNDRVKISFMKDYYLDFFQGYELTFYQFKFILLNFFNLARLKKIIYLSKCFFKKEIKVILYGKKSLRKIN